MGAAEVQFDEACRARDKIRGMLKKVDAVNGVGISRVEGRYAVKVNVAKQLDSDTRIPASIDGVPVVVHVVGKIRKQA